ncbi:hypothetical protein PUNSTDRAFT_145429 [Punctularia strigosozonata HHB-11173 SS5]|uniref:uncharacterized protein n=1 Tax=Punctularia strigosozonata (strain HHB-11173) TaxID=741275 RepID=UPI0004417184|nr:uncharacterized protein PUNSTDRAFT_145429 [Punctularia strigosozonata HHB-11173 SS5]EIN06065.1 hypothetical protein PUNSTDRAFT_145429 [Punctularia strigosozonata HHB-11173 SS5]
MDGLLGAPKFPHTRAELAAIARQYKPLDFGDDPDAEDYRNLAPGLLRRVVSLLDAEDEDELKALLRETYGMDEGEAEEHVLNLMHRHRDDAAGVPFLFFATANRTRPLSRPSSRASNHSTVSARLAPTGGRPETPLIAYSASAPSSPLALVFRRPHTPATSPLAHTTGQSGGGTNNNSNNSNNSSNSNSNNNNNSYMTANPGGVSDSPSSSPTLAYALPAHAHAQFAASLPASPLSSPRLLSAKASEFRPVGAHPLTRTHSNPGSLAALRAQTPSPDLWAHTAGAASLAIARPLVPDGLVRASTPSSGLRSSVRLGPPDVDEEDDPFDPFAGGKTRGPLVFGNGGTGTEAEWSRSGSSHSGSSLGGAEGERGLLSFGSPERVDAIAAVVEGDADGYGRGYDYGREYSDVYGSAGGEGAGGEELNLDESEAQAVLTGGMTPFDVLSSVFGTTLAPSELEEALANHNYEFEKAMAWLIERALPAKQPPASVASAGRGGIVVGRDGMRGGGRADARGGAGPRYGGRMAAGGNRVCRYFLAGECLRADCRFSHDLERAMCRFWLRGTCAKGENCEFLHHLPPEVDVSRLATAMSHADLGARPLAAAAVRPGSSPPADDFPALGAGGGAPHPGGGNGGGGGHNKYDPWRTRFAAAVKRAAPGAGMHRATPSQEKATLAARRQAMGASADPLHHHTAIVAPRPSPRVRLRPPRLLPTLPTGEAVNGMYMDYRRRALQLGAARNACLSRAADAWRRGDGAAAKRFSREGHELNAKMGREMEEAARRLVRERAKVAEGAVRMRDAGWSDDPADRAERGKRCGGGLGVVLGVVGNREEGNKLSPEERTEAMLDLHGLHSNEATEVLEDFLASLEKEHFYGLAYLVVGEEKHTGTQDAARGASRARLAAGVREWLHRWGYPWSETQGVICVDPLTHE